MAFLTALLTGLGGYGAGRQQAVQNKQTQEGLTQNQGYLDIAQQAQKQKQDEDSRNRGINPDTMQPYAVPQNLTNATGGKPNHGVATPAQLYAWHIARAKMFSDQGNQNAANIELAAAQDTSKATLAQNALSQRLMLDQFNQGNMNERTLETIAGAAGRNQNTESNANTRSDNMIAALLQRALIGADTSTQNNIRTTNTSAANTAAHIQQDMRAQVDNDMRGYETQNAAALKAGTTPPHPNLDPFKANLGAAIALVSKDPKQLQRALKDLNAHASDYGPALIMYGQRQLQDAAAAAKQGAQAGGSSTTANPTSGGYKLPQSNIWQMLIDNGATPDEATKLSAIAYAESGGDPTSVNPTDNHGKQTSWGLFQISDGTHNEPQGWQDPEVNTRMAIAKLRSKQGLHAWGTYNSGAYEQYLPGGK